MADLHIHTVLSPCAEESMTPAAIVWEALERGLAMIAICDHNAAANTAAAQRAAGDELAVIAGIEITTTEEVHLVGLFPDAASACAVADKVRAGLPPLVERTRWMGEQRIVDEEGSILGREPKMLAAASAFSLAEAVELVRWHGGLAIAAHLDRPSFSVLSQLGMMPEGLAFDAIEVSPAGLKKGKHKEFAPLGWAIVCSSDAHSTDEIGDGRTVFELEEPTFEELRKAFRAEGGRRCRLA